MSRGPSLPSITDTDAGKRAPLGGDTSSLSPQTAAGTGPNAGVWALQAAMRALPQVELETQHYFADGMYCRVVPHAAGVLVVGKVQRREHFFMVVQGAVAVIQDGAEERIYRAPAILVSAPGTKRAALALEDSVVLTVHRTDKTELADIELELVEPDDTALFGPDNKLKALEFKQ